MSAPEWTKDEVSIETAKDYLRQGDTVDFYEKIASSLLREHPKDVLGFCYQLVTEMRAGVAPKEEGEFQPKKEEDAKYMRANGISDFLDKWILALLEARPATNEDRMAYHQAYLKKLLDEKAGVPAS